LGDLDDDDDTLDTDGDAGGDSNGINAAADNFDTIGFTVVNDELVTDGDSNGLIAAADNFDTVGFELGDFVGDFCVVGGVVVVDGVVVVVDTVVVVCVDVDAVVEDGDFGAVDTEVVDEGDFGAVDTEVVDEGDFGAVVGTEVDEEVCAGVGGIGLSLHEGKVEEELDPDGV